MKKYKRFYDHELWRQTEYIQNPFKTLVFDIRKED